MEDKKYLDEINRQLRKMFRASREGHRVADVDRHRLEGFMQAGVFLKLATPQEMAALLEEAHYSVFGKTIRERKAEKSTAWPDIEIDYGKFESPTYLR